jgi:hypothetical protein
LPKSFPVLEIRGDDMGFVSFKGFEDFKEVKEFNDH